VLEYFFISIFNFYKIRIIRNYYIIVQYRGFRKVLKYIAIYISLNMKIKNAEDNFTTATSRW